jgi:hypothetical protein
LLWRKNIDVVHPSSEKYMLFNLTIVPLAMAGDWEGRRRLSRSHLPGTLNPDINFVRKIIEYKFDYPEAAPERLDV